MFRLWSIFPAAKPPEFALDFVGTNVPVPYVATLLGAVVLFELLPYVEELLRGLKARAQGNARRIR